MRSRGFTRGSSKQTGVKDGDASMDDNKHALSVVICVAVLVAPTRCPACEYMTVVNEDKRVV